MARFRFLLIFSYMLSTVFAVQIAPLRVSDTKKECYGTYNRLNLINNKTYHYNRIKRIFGDCTYVHGNLEVTHLTDPKQKYDLDFLSEIEVVTGYVLIGIIGSVTKIPLTSLKLIKGERPMRFQDGRYGLMVLGTRATELQLPALREISNGDVILLANQNLCHVNTIVWEEVTSNEVTIYMTANPDNCEECPASCEDQAGHRHCWGSSGSMCQSVKHLRCDVMCPGSPKLCHKEGMLGCCHSQCAVGCFGSRNTQCLMCKNYKYRHQCLPSCPNNTYAYAGYCVNP